MPIMDVELNRIWLFPKRLRDHALASAYVLLASRANARGMTGQIITVDAGSSLRWARRG